MVFSSHDTLEPGDIALLRRVLEEVCDDKSIPLDHPDAQEIARDLVNWFLFGIKDPLELRKMLDPLPI
ncbi:hypothetical protein EPK99_04300 [Neorhizobium lilium]|uniref:Uncharacterized protein n=1 Tax=Neorhizobium lilium TaxID=2503024 RepID=A0A3S3VTH0_9HYPH|nr:hypothetical protein [Neorhizobium lilium]RWX81513.1 hypothetical protein EPK99_04300 [Neorhizobium lilium]